MKHIGKNDNSNYQKEKTYKMGSQLFYIKREYCGNRKLGEIISDMILKKEINGK
jgi:hypothetical protein